MPDSILPKINILLSDQSIAILQEIDEDIEIKSFFETGAPDKKTVQNADGISKPTTLISSLASDPNKEPLLARNMISHNSRSCFSLQRQTT